MNIIRLIRFLISLFFVSSNLFAQVNRADKLFEAGKYDLAIAIYQKIINENNDRYAAMQLAECYRLTNNTNDAEIWYAKVVSFENTKPINHFYYGQILKSNAKYKDAQKQFLLYSDKVPDDIRGGALAASCDSISLWKSKRRRYSLVNAASLNTEYAEFSPAYYKNTIVFSSDRINRFLNNKQIVNRLLNLYLAKYGQDIEYNLIIKSPKLFSGTFNKGSHNGTACISANNNTMFFTMSVLHKDKNPTLQLFYATVNGHRWFKEQPFIYNSDAYSLSYPFLSSEGKELYFVSDMPGGYGGTDIYVCYKDGESWKRPINLGPRINSAGDEKSPFLHQNGGLYFASDGHAGYGGLDIYVANKQDDVWHICNMKAPFNSPEDDFGLILDENNMTGFLSSNRNGGKGDDDIYYVKKNIDFNCVSVYQDYCVILTASEDTSVHTVIYEWVFGIEENKIGRVVEHCYPGPGTYYVQLIVKSEETDEILYHEKQIKIEIEDNESNLPKIDIMTESKIKLMKSVKFDASGFVDGCSISKYIWDMGDGSLIEGKSINYTYKEAGEYKVSLKLLSEGMPCFISCDTCVYKLITVYEDAMKINVGAIDTNIWIKGKVIDKSTGVPVRGLTLILESDDYVDVRETSDDGFYFFIIESNTVYNLSILSDDYFNINEEFSTYNKKEMLSINKDIEVERIELNKAIAVDNIYYDIGDFRIKPFTARELEKIVTFLRENPNIRIEISSHTDSKSDKASNQILSEKRAKAVVAYIISKGIEQDRLVAKGYGESKLVNHCADGVKCSEDEHSQNRRTEIKVIEYR